MSVQWLLPPLPTPIGTHLVLQPCQGGIAGNHAICAEGTYAALHLALLCAANLHYRPPGHLASQVQVLGSTCFHHSMHTDCVSCAMQDMAWCQGYAFQNRKHMLDLMVDSVVEVTGATPDLQHSVNIHHNYCQCERCEYTVSCLLCFTALM